MKRWNIRIRLTLLFAVIQVLFMAGLTLAVHWVFGRELMREVDQGLRDKAEALTAAYEMKSGFVEVEMDEHLRETLWLDSLAQILSPQGEVLFQNQFGPKTSMPAPPRDDKATEPVFYIAYTPDHGELRCIRRTDQRYASPVVIAVGTPLKKLRHEQAELLRIMLLASGGMVTTSLLVGWVVIGRLLRPLAAMVAKTRQITADHLHDRLEVPNPHDEIGRLAVTLNDMIERLDASFVQMRQFTSDASHELRTPLTSMRSEVEVALQQPRSPDEYRDLLGSILEEIERLTRLSDTLLTLTRLDQGKLDLHREPVALGELVMDAVDRVRIQAESKGKRITLLPAAPDCSAYGDRRLLEQVVLNLVDNAIKYGGSEITVGTSASDKEVRLVVHDNGEGIPAEHVPRLFERFYRVDKSRARDLGGVGLGLALVRQFVELHGGKVIVESIVRAGTTFTVILPSSVTKECL